MPTQPAKPPPGLNTKARELWKRTVETYALRADELCLLEEACREATLIDRMEVEVRVDGLIVEGSMGQPVANPLVQEIRQHRQTFLRLIHGLRLPEVDEELGDRRAEERSSKARTAANARWGRGA